jgi:hypothetical protein
LGYLTVQKEPQMVIVEFYDEKTALLRGKADKLMRLLEEKPPRKCDAEMIQKLQMRPRTVKIQLETAFTEWKGCKALLVEQGQMCNRRFGMTPTVGTLSARTPHEARHNPLCDIYHDLRGRIYHIVDDGQSLAERIAQLRRTRKIRSKEDAIKKLIVKSDGLLGKKEKLFKEAGADTPKIDVEKCQRIAEISATKVGFQREKRQLEEADTQIKEWEATTVEELKETQLRGMLENRDAENNKKHERLQTLENAGVATAYEVAEVWKLCRETMTRRPWKEQFQKWP